MTLFTSGITYWDFFFGDDVHFAAHLPCVSLLGTKSIHFEDSHPDEGSSWP